MKHTVQEELRGILLFLGAIWGAFFLKFLLPFDIDNYGVTPRTVVGLGGIPAMPFLHASLRHLLNNSIPLFVLLTLLAGSQARSWEVVLKVILLSGGLLWLFGRTATHIGASGLVFGLIVFLIVSGFVERRITAILVAMAVGFLFGGTLLMGVVPQWDARISWDGHLFGAVSGGLVAYFGNRLARVDEQAAKASASAAGREGDT